MRYRIALILLTLVCSVELQHRADGQFSANEAPQSTEMRDSFLHEHSLFRSVSDKPDCDETYPLPDNYQNWKNCKKDGGGSACGGPQQCACLESQRLITFTCDQGSYHQCYGEQGNGCRGN